MIYLVQANREAKPHAASTAIKSKLATNLTNQQHERKIMSTIRTTVTNVRASGGRISWLKTISSVDKAKKNGYAFEGDFISLDQEVELEIGAIVIEKEPQGSVKNGRFDGNIYRVVGSPIEGQRNPCLELITYFDWEKGFLSFRDRVAKELDKCQAQKADAKDPVNEIKEMLTSGQVSSDKLVTALEELNKSAPEAIALLHRLLRG